MLRNPFRYPRAFLHACPILVALFVTGLTHAANEKLARGPWPLVPKEAASDSQVVWGQLPNGLRYAILPVESDARAVSLRLVVDVGSAMDPQGLDGMARTVSRMPLNGTRSFGREELMQFFIGEGMPFFAESFADTKLLQTFYRLDLENPGDASVETGMRFLGDVLSGMAFPLPAVEIERSAISRTGNAGRGGDAYAAELAMFANSPLVEKSVAESAIASVKPEDLEAFWKKWYTVDRATVLVVGAVSPDAIATLIEQRFGGLVGTGLGVELPEPGKLRGTGGVDIVDGSTIATRASLVNVSDPFDPFSVDGERMLLARRFVGAYAQAVNDGDGLLNDDVVTVHRNRAVLELRALGTPLNLQELVKNLDTAAHRLDKNGIGQEALIDARAEYRKEQARSMRGEATSEAERLLRCVVSGEPFRPRDSYLRFLDRTLPTFDSGYVTELCRSMLSEKRCQFVLVIPPMMGLQSKHIEKGLKNMRKGYNFAWAVEGRPTSSWQVKPGFNETGMVLSTKRSDVAGYSLLQYAFQNSLRVNYLQTDDPVGTFRIQLSLGNGLSDLNEPFPGAAYFARSLLGKMKLGREASSTLWTVLAGKGFRSIDAGMDIDHMWWAASGEEEDDLATFFSLMGEWIYLSRITKEDFDEVMEQAKPLAKRGGEALAQERLEEALYADARLRKYFTTEELEEITFDAMSEWFQNVMENGYMEVTIVGNIDPRRALTAARKTLGALPKRQGKALQPRHGAPAKLPAPGKIEKTVDWKSEQSLVEAMWPMPTLEFGCGDAQRLEMLSKLLITYAAQSTRDGASLLNGLRVETSGSRIAPGSMGISMSFRCAVGKEDAAMAEAYQIIEDFLAWLNPDLMASAARGAVAERARRNRQRSYLLTILDQSQGRPALLDCFQSDVANMDTYFEYETTMESYRKTLARDNARVVFVKPSK